jgi:hypothetical protein
VEVRAVVIVAAVVVCDSGGVAAVAVAGALKAPGTLKLLMDGARVDPLRVRERMRMENLSLKLGLRGCGGGVVGSFEGLEVWRSHWVTRLDLNGEGLGDDSRG